MILYCSADASVLYTTETGKKRVKEWNMKSIKETAVWVTSELRMRQFIFPKVQVYLYLYWNQTTLYN